MEKNVDFKIVKSKSGIPCLWERGGGWSNTGSSQIICDSVGKPKKPIYVKRKGELACSDHALIPIQKGDVVIRAKHHREDFDIEVFSIASFKSKDGEEAAETSFVSEFNIGEWSNDNNLKYKDAINAAMAKATDYHCRVPYFVIEDEEKPIKPLTEKQKGIPPQYWTNK
jgi:hypothetical protein